MKKLAGIILIIVLLCSSLAFADQTFRYGITTNPRGMFNPILYTERYDNYIISQVYDGLIYIDSQLQPQPLVAKDWEISEDQLSITFFLHEGITFHDGQELTAEDVAYTFKAILHPDYTGVRYGNFKVLQGAEAYKKGEAQDVTGIEVLDKYTIKFTTTEPYAPLVASFSYGILPSHLLKQIPVGELETATFNLNPVGSGPFVFKEFLTDQHVILEANKNYFFGAPKINTLVFQKIADDAVPIYIQQNRVDYVGISPEHYPQVIGLKSFDTYIYEALGYSYIAFNLRQNRFQDVKVRQAMTYGFDRESYVEIIRDGFGIIANAPMPQASWAFNSDGINNYEYNPDLAAEMLKEAGWNLGSDGILHKNGEKLHFDFLIPDGSRLTEQMALLFQQNMEDLGIKVNLVFMEFSAAVDRVDARQFDLFTMAWSLSVDPDPYSIWHSAAPWNDPGFVHARSDELLELGRSETNQDKRKEIYGEWQQIINYELPYIFLQYDVSISAIGKKVKGIDETPGPLGPLQGDFLIRSLWLD